LGGFFPVPFHPFGILEGFLAGLPIGKDSGQLWDFGKEAVIFLAPEDMN
jgi:hypothetical protein